MKEGRLTSCFLIPYHPDMVTVRTSEVGVTPQPFNVNSLRWRTESRRNKLLSFRQAYFLWNGGGRAIAIFIFALDDNI
jgi:hypothetical protein